MIAVAGGILLALAVLVVVPFLLALVVAILRSPTFWYVMAIVPAAILVVLAVVACFR